jgi:flagellar hook-associated protein 1
MPSISATLNIAASALIAEQAAIQVTGQNISNAQTVGYSEQQAQLEPSTPERTPTGIFGTGVSVVNVTRTRDALLDQEARTPAAPAAGFQTRSDLLGQISGVFGEPSSTGLSSTLDAFWNSWSALATDPSNPATKTQVQEAGTNLANTLNSYAQQVDAIDASTRGAISDTINQVNTLTTQIAAMNTQIVTAQSGGQSANDVLDQRDNLIDQLAQLVPVNVIDRTNGSDQITIGGISIVDGSVSKALSSTGGAPVTITVGGNTTTLQNPGGKLGALVQVVNSDIPGVKAGLNAIAASLVTDVNTVHETGWSPPSGAAGNWNPATPPTGSGVDFFDPSPANATAENIKLSAAVAADPNAIASSDTLNATGNNNVALAIAGLRDFSPSAAGNSFSGAYSSLVSTVAAAQNSATSSASVYQTLAQHADQQRQSVQGVNTDQELVALMQHQSVYVAASKYIQIVDAMTESLLTMTTS